MIIKLLILLIFTACGASKNSNRPTLEPKKPDTPALKTRDINTASGITRNLNAPLLTNEEHHQLRANQKLEDAYKDIPSLDYHSESKVLRPRVVANFQLNCGNQEGQSIQDRINECHQLHADTLITNWSGQTSAFNSEGDWVMLSQIYDGAQTFFLWIDLRTKLVWTESIKEEEFRIASGTDGFVTSRTCQFLESGMSAKFGTLTNKQVHWRLPTRSDFLQADLHGARFVLPDVAQTYWSASFIGQNLAWAIEQSTGVLKQESIDHKHAVRCIGELLETI